MIKVGIVGCDNLRSAELVRVLINHPDVELKWVTSACDEEGTRLDSIVPGVVGECDLVVNACEDYSDVDVVFLCEKRSKVDERLSALDLPDEVHFIDLSGAHNLDHGPDTLWTYGLSEMQRRILVHEAHLVTVPGSAATAALLVLMPLARNLLINSPLSLQIAMGAVAFAESGATIDGLDITHWADEQQREIALALSQCQSSFNQPIDLTITPVGERRTMAVTARLKCGVDDDVIRQLYESYYDDHNFIFIVDRPVVPADVENTNKCLMRLEKDERSGELTVRAMMDVLLKGCVGNAVHAMNLLFGLHERVGLTLKATGC